MKLFRTRTRKPAALCHTLRRRLELLECRDVPAALSIIDVALREGPTSLGILDPIGAANAGINGVSGMTFRSNGDLFVTGRLSHSVARFDWASQTYQPFVTSDSGGLGEAYGIAIGPDGNVYVSDPIPKKVFRFDGATGAPLPAPGRPGAVYVADDPNTPAVDESGGLTEARGITFGADGNLYVCSRDTHQILRYEGPSGSSPGAFIGVFATVTNGRCPQNLTFGPDGNLYVGLLNMGFSIYSQINRYDGTTGAPIGNEVFVPLASGGLCQSRQIVIDAQGTNLYVVESQSIQGVSQVLRYQGPSGANPGAYVEAYITSGQGGFSQAMGLAQDVDGNLYVSDQDNANVMRFGPTAQARFVVTLDAASTNQVSVNYATANGTATASSDYAPTSGTLTFIPGETTKTISVSTLDDLTGEPTETFQVNLLNAMNATIADSQGVGNIRDNETKFFVVDGTSGKPRTYEYGSGGSSEEITPQRDANTAPRGVATTAAGTTVWVVDANTTVYVYNNGGALLGSWSAGSLPMNAQVEGITTNGTDIWLVDAKQDKVYRYAGAASRLSGSQNAASSFNLNNGNSNPKDLVTDGTSIWIVNDAATDKVFKYTLSGALLGNWAIVAANASPTGITLDPTNGQQHLWVVDSAADKVFQYDDARSRTSGSQGASTTFTLAASNTDPQGIADPPAISIDDATATEGSAAIRLIDDFVPTQSGGLDNPLGLVFRGRELFVASGVTDSVLRYDGSSGHFLGAFVSPAAGGLDFPFGITFGPDGHLYVGSTQTSQVLRYDGATGAFLGEFVSAGSGGLMTARGIAFGPDGNLYVASERSHQILRYQGPAEPVPGAFMGVFAATASARNPFALAFRPDGNLYVAYSPHDQDGSGTNTLNTGFVNRYNGSTGAFLDTYIPTGAGGLKDPRSLTFDQDGNLYLSNGFADGGVLRYQGPGGPTPGGFLGVFVPAGLGGLNAPLGLSFDQDSNLYVASRATDQVFRYGFTSQAVFTVQLSEPSALPVTVNFATTNGTAIAGSDYKTATGTITFSPGQTNRTILVQTFDDALSEPTETFVVNLSNPVGAEIADGQAVGTIVDNEPLQVTSAVVNGGAAQRSRVTDLTVTFTGLATLPANPAGAFRLTRTGPTGLTGDVALSVDLSASTATQTIARLTFSSSFTEFGSLIDGNYTLTVLGSQVTGNGQPLDGDADGAAGGDYTLQLHRLFGDANGDHVVNAADLTLFRAAYGGDDPTFDVNGDGVINVAELAAFRTNFGVSV